jgi:SSS family solute:Na+ symporter
MYLLALALAPLTGWDVVTIILLTGIVVIAYTLIGGMEAVIWTDVVQSFVFIIGALACVVILLAGMPQGPAQAFQMAIARDKFSLGSFSFDFADTTFWVVFIYGIFINLQNFGIDQSYVQRYATARSDAEAAKSVWTGALLYLPISAVFFFIGTALFSFYTVQPELLVAAKLDPLKDSAKIFPHFIATDLPLGVGGLVVAAIFAAAQSTISSSINCSATLILCDLYRRYFRPAATEGESLLVLRVATVGVGFGGTFTAVAVAVFSGKQVLDVWWELAGIFSGGMLGLFLLGLLARRASRPAAAVGVILGVLVICWMSLSSLWPGAFGNYQSPFHKFMAIVIGTLAILLVGLLASALAPRGKNQGTD